MNQEREDKFRDRQVRVGQIFDELSVVQDEHRILTHGRHSLKYIEKSKIVMDYSATSEICAMFAEDFKDDDIEVVVGPAFGGIILAYETARQLSQLTGRKVLNVFAEKLYPPRLEFRNAFKNLLKNRNVLMIEDVVTTGESILEVKTRVEENEGIVKGLGIICNRGGIDLIQLGIPKTSTLLDLSIPSYSPEECPAQH